MALASKLDLLGAVNLMLAASGEQKVSTLVDDGINDTDFAQQILNEKILEVVSDGWDYNTVKVTLYPDNNNKITISKNFLRVDGAGDDYRRRLSVRNGFLFDLDTNTDQFTETSVVLKVTQNIDFEDFPSPLRFYIARASARTYQMQTVGDTQIDQVLAQEEMRAWERCKKDSSKTRDKNWIHDSRSTSRLIGERNVKYTEDFNNSRPL